MGRRRTDPSRGRIAWRDRVINRETYGELIWTDLRSGARDSEAVDHEASPVRADGRGVAVADEKHGEGSRFDATTLNSACVSRIE